MSGNDEAAGESSGEIKRPQLITGAPSNSGPKFVTPAPPEDDSPTLAEDKKVVAESKSSPLVTKKSATSVKPSKTAPKAETPKRTPAKPVKKAGMGMTAKATLGTLLGLAIAILGWVLVDRMAANKRNEQIQALFNEAAKTGIKSVPMSEEQLDWLLDYVSSVSFDKDKAAAYQTIALARPTGSGNFDRRIKSKILQHSYSRYIQ